MTVCVCRACGHRAALRSVFEGFFCPECGEEDSLEPEDAYDPEPIELVCAVCRYRVDARPSGDGVGVGNRLTPEDPCPRCGRAALAPPEEKSRPGIAQREVAVAPEFVLARAAAERVLDRHWTGETPVDVRKIAVAMGLRVVASSAGHQGRLTEDVIEVPDDEARVAQRFVIAHEIGHHELRHQVPEAKVETEANAFASELLIPRPRLKRAVEAGLSFDELRRHFDVSSEALTYAIDGAKLLSKLAKSC
jgi:predicted RNA-binding Zn-ribbon protein involved in translation (DUF1610 family)